MLRTLFLSLALAASCQAQTAATIEAQITALSNRITALQETVAIQSIQIVAQNAENASLQKQIALAQSNATIQAANLAALSKAFTPVQTSNTWQQTQVVDLETASSNLQARLTTIENNPVLALGPFVSVNLAPTNGTTGPIITFSGVNVQIENGMGQTGLTNGLGNLFIGYAEQNPSNDYDPVPLPLFRNGSHSVIIGAGHSFSGFGNLICGGYNRAQGNSQLIAGYYNSAGSGEYSSDLGGAENWVLAGSFSTVVGCYSNAVNYIRYAVIVGGVENQEGIPCGVLLGGENVMAQTLISANGVQ
jgi:hypothetical protein